MRLYGKYHDRLTLIKTNIMEQLNRKIDCLIAQMRQEKETRLLLNNMSDGRTEQIVEKRKAEVRARYGLSMDDSMKY